MLNEVFVTLTLYHIICFTDHNSVFMRTQLGYSFCFLLGIHVLGNIAFIVIMGLKEAIWGWKKRVVVKRELKRVSRLKKANEVNESKFLDEWRYIPRLTKKEEAEIKSIAEEFIYNGRMLKVPHAMIQKGLEKTKIVADFVLKRGSDTLDQPLG